MCDSGFSSGVPREMKCRYCLLLYQGFIFHEHRMTNYESQAASTGVQRREAYSRGVSDERKLLWC